MLFIIYEQSLIMETIIRILKEMREKAERSFIDNSLIVINTRGDKPIPDTESDLKKILNSGLQKT